MDRPCSARVNGGPCGAAHGQIEVTVAGERADSEDLAEAAALGRLPLEPATTSRPLLNPPEVSPSSPPRSTYSDPAPSCPSTVL